MSTWLKRGAVAAAGIAATASAVLLPTAVAHAEVGTDFNRWCGNSSTVQQIQVEEWPDGKFKILVTPTRESRYYPDVYGTTATTWHAIQDCVPGLYGELADSIWDQLYCHQDLALTPAKTLDGYASGDTYDLESWRPTGANYVNHCGNTLNVEAEPVDEGYRYRPDGRDPGYDDIAPPSNVG